MSDSEQRVKRHIQSRGHSRPVPVLTNEAEALCRLLDELRTELVAARKAIFALRHGGDSA